MLIGWILDFFLGYWMCINQISGLVKLGDQALISISTILKFSALESQIWKKIFILKTSIPIEAGSNDFKEINASFLNNPLSLLFKRCVFLLKPFSQRWPKSHFYKEALKCHSISRNQRLMDLKHLTIACKSCT